MAISLISCLRTLGNKILSVESKKLTKRSFTEIFCTVASLRNFECVGTNGWTINDASGYRCGTSLRLYVYASGGSTGAGNITNQQVCTITFDDACVVDFTPRLASSVSSTGGAHALYLKREAMNPYTLSLWIAHTHAAASAITFSKVIPIEIDVTKY